MKTFLPGYLVGGLFTQTLHAFGKHDNLAGIVLSLCLAAATALLVIRFREISRGEAG